jgi:hypothetical protein
MISKLEDFKAYNFAKDVGEQVWDGVLKWQYFDKDTVGKQLVKTVDSIAVNLSEGITLRKEKTLPIIQEDHCLKPKHG